MARNPVSRLRRFALVTTALAGSLTLAACFGSGSARSYNPGIGPGSGFRSGGGGLPIATYEADPEYQAMGGLSLIGASTYYNGGSNPNGYTGSGITVSVIDSGIDPDHPEFVGALHPDSQSVVGGSVEGPDDHGSAVAGVVGANRNGSGMHGVAFNSTILAIRADICLFPGICGFFTDSDLRAATDLSVAADADIINYSLGGTAPSTAEFRDALIRAVNNDTVIVAAAGNDFLIDPVTAANPQYPAVHAIEPQMDGQILVAGAYDEGIGDIANFSNRAGIAQDFYLLAPGVDIYTAAGGGGYTFTSGTSFAAPMIAGAAALLKERFPSLLAEQIVDILLVSATDLGPAGTDATYGRGLLNLAAAAAPLGVLSIPSTASVDGGGADPDATSLTLGAAFGDALTRSGALADAIFLDGYGRPYPIDLTASIAMPTASPDVLGFLVGGTDVERFVADLTAGTQVYVQADTGDASAPWTDISALAEGSSDAVFSVRQSISEGIDITVAQGIGAGGQFGLHGAGTWTGSGMLPTSDASFIGMADSGGNATFATALGDSLQMRFGVGVNQATLGEEIEGSADDASVFVAEVTHTDETGLRLGIQLGRLVEDGSLLEAGGEGAYAVNGSATTDFITAFGVVPLTGTLEVFGSYTTGLSDAGSLSTDLIGDFDGVRSDALSLGIGGRDLLARSDRFALVLIQPLRVASGTASVSAPVSRTLEGAVNFGQETVGLTPSGRETDAEFSYGIALGDNEQIDFSFIARFEPDHVQDAAPEFATGLRYRVTF